MRGSCSLLRGSFLWKEPCTVVCHTTERVGRRVTARSPGSPALCVVACSILVYCRKELSTKGTRRCEQDQPTTQRFPCSRPASPPEPTLSLADHSVWQRRGRLIRLVSTDRHRSQVEPPGSLACVIQPSIITAATPP